MIAQQTPAAAAMGALFYATAVSRITAGALPDDFWLVLSATGIGSIGGSFVSIAVRPPRNPTPRTLAIRWVASALSGILVCPFLVEHAHNKLGITPTPYAIIAFSAAFSFVAWQVLSWIIRHVNSDGFAALLRHFLNMPKR